MNCIIMRGVPGSGKTTMAKKLAAEIPGCVIVSADDWFTGADGVYRFRPDQLKIAHETCRELFAKALLARASVIVDNTNTQRWEFKSYVDAALMAGYHVEFAVIEPKLSAETYAARCTHGVPVTQIQRMIDRWEAQP